MWAPVHLLLAGYEHSLMQSRSIMLRRAGFVVDQAYNLNAVLGLVKADTIDAVLLCHTIPRDEQLSLISSLRELRRQLPIVCIKLHEGDLPQPECVMSESEPVELIAAICKALAPPVAMPIK